MPAWTSDPLPLIMPAKASVSARSNTSVPSLATSPAMLPVVPPLPSRSVPAAIVVPPA